MVKVIDEKVSILTNRKKAKRRKKRKENEPNDGRFVESINEGEGEIDPVLEQFTGCIEVVSFKEGKVRGDVGSIVAICFCLVSTNV